MLPLSLIVAITTVIFLFLGAFLPLTIQIWHDFNPKKSTI